MIKVSLKTELVEQLLAGAFIVGVFYGDIHYRFVFPVALLVLPVLLAFIVIRRRSIAGGFNVGVALLVGLLSAVALQQIAGVPAPTRADLSTYAPAFYAIATVFTFSLVRMSDSMLWRSLVAGGIVTAACLVAIVAFVPDGKFVIPGQDFAVTEHEFMQDRSPGRDVTKYHSSALVIPGDTDDKSVRPFYDIKNKIRNSLGRSNYLAVFFVFLFAVAVFCQSRWFAVLFALLTIATLSRFGILWMCAVFLLWLAHRSKLPAKKIIGAIFLCVLAAVLVVILFPSLLQRVPGIQSFDARLSFWASGLQPAADHFLVGAPRSALLDKYGYMITWNPHNSVIWIISIFGTWGLMFYGAYVFLGMRSIYRQATEPLWLGIFVGLAVAFAWSMFEIIVLTPAFEILMAVIFGVALAKERDSKKLAST